jgi:hypothetical protein
MIDYHAHTMTDRAAGYRRLCTAMVIVTID